MTMLALMAEAFYNPKTSAPRILSARLGLRESVLMVVAAVALMGALRMCVHIAAPELLKISPPQIAALDEAPAGAHSDREEAASEPEHPMATSLKELGLSVAQFFIVSVLAWAIGRNFGGEGDFEAVASMVSWHILISAPFAVLTSISMVAIVNQQGTILDLVVLLGLAVYLLYVFAVFISKAHGFEKIGRVMAVSFVFGFAAMIVLNMLASIGLGAG